MTNRVLDERLQNQVRHERQPRPGLDLELDRQPLTESRTLDVEVRVEARELLLERDLILTGTFQGEAQQRVQLSQHPLGRAGCLVRELRDRVHAVEQKMRLELQPEELQLRA